MFNIIFSPTDPEMTESDGPSFSYFQEEIYNFLFFSLSNSKLIFSVNDVMKHGEAGAFMTF